MSRRNPARGRFTVPFALALAAVVAALGFGNRGTWATPLAGAGGTGALSVTSDPTGAAVYVDGDYVGRTPISVPRVPAGDHRVRVVKDGYLENARVIKLTPDRTDAIQIRLTPRAAQNRAAQTPADCGSS
jgi:hypothetical protein